jgi:hypothetical protein
MTGARAALANPLDSTGRRLTLMASPDGSSTLPVVLPAGSKEKVVVVPRRSTREIARFVTTPSYVKLTIVLSGSRIAVSLPLLIVSESILATDPMDGAVTVFKRGGVTEVS